MKMVSAAKYAQAERRLKPARTYGAGAVDVYDKTGAEGPEAVTKQLIIAISSDRGLCGGIHSGINKYIKNYMAATNALPSSSEPPPTPSRHRSRSTAGSRPPP